MAIEALDRDMPGDVLAFLEERLGQRGLEHWTWKYRLGEGQGPNAFFWRGSDGAVLGFIGMLRTTLHHGGNSWPAAWFVDWQVTPGERGVGVGMGLLRKAEASAGILLTLQGSADTRLVLPRLGWKESTRPATWIKPLGGRFVGDWASRHSASWLAAPVAAIAGPALALLDGRPTAPALVTARDDDGAAPGDDDVWSRRRDELAPLMCRNRAAVDWFCRAYPGGGYRIAALNAGTDEAGRLVTRVDSDARGLRRGRIVDLLWPRTSQRWIEEALDLACRRLADEGADYVQCLSSRPELDAALQTLRFQRRNRVPVWYHRLPPGAPHPDTWFVSLLDCDRAYR